MAYDIQPLTAADLPELGRFLRRGFHAPDDAAFAAADVLGWKYFDSCGRDAGDAPRSYLARHAETGAVVGHVGACRTRFRGSRLKPSGVSTVHMIDWLSSKAGPGVGASLMRRVHQTTETQYGFGGSAAGRGVIGRGGYELVANVPVFQNVLRPNYRLRAVGSGPVGRVLRAVKDVVGKAVRPPKQPTATVELRPVQEFGSEAEQIVAAYESCAIFTTREPALLNHFLRYPRGGVTGWYLVHDGVVRGLAVLSIVPRPGGVREGRVAECLLDSTVDDLWHAAISALTSDLKRQGADLAVGFASTNWLARALRAAGYIPLHSLEFRLRDRMSMIPRSAPFHLTPLEADYAYT
jgi:hypothetical protein